MGEKIQFGDRQFTRGQIARGTGLSLSHVSRIFSGQRFPSILVAKRIAGFLGVKEQEVIDHLIRGGSGGSSGYGKVGGERK